MINTIRKMHVKTAYQLGGIFYLLTIFIHLLVISEILPFTWVNGGRSESFSDQLSISIISMIITISVGIVLLILVKKSRNTPNKFLSIVCWCLVIFYLLGFIQQLLGTPFEKFICSIILLIGILSHLRIAIEKKFK